MATAPQKDDGRAASHGDQGGWSSRDVAIVEMLARNVPRADIAQALSCSIATVDRRISTLRDRLGVTTTIQVIVHAVRSGAI